MTDEHTDNWMGDPDAELFVEHPVKPGLFEHFGITVAEARSLQHASICDEHQWPYGVDIDGDNRPRCVWCEALRADALERKIRAMKTKAELQADNNRLNESETVLHMALNDLINHQVHWIRKGNHKLGLSRVNSPHGGILIHLYTCKGQTPYACAYYWENWARPDPEFAHFGKGKDEQDLRAAAIEARSWINSQRAM